MFKKYVFAAFLLLSACSATLAQEAVPRTEEYCMILATSKLLSAKVNITIDYGQERKLISFADTRVKDSEGRVQNFNSPIDALNYMNSQGWEFVNAYSITVSNQNVYHYVMRRKL